MGPAAPSGRAATGVAARIRDICAIDPGAPAVEFERRWYTWGDLARTGSTISAAMDDLSLGEGAQVGVVLRNRPVPVGAFLGVLVAGGCVVVVNPHLGAERVTADLEQLDLALVVGEPADLDAMVSPAQRHRTSVLALPDLGAAADLERSADHPTGRDAYPGVAFRLLTSGTTGPPKRIELAHDLLERVLTGAKHYESDTRTELRLRDGVAIVNSPMVHLGGPFRVLQAVTDGRRFALLERFTVEGWVDVVRRHRPRTASLVPTALRMVLDAEVDPDDLSSLRSVVSGTAPLSPDVAEAFTARYGIPVLTNYAATEFGGAVAGWTLADHQRFWADKRGSAGRAHPGTELRVVDQDTGQVLPTGDTGLLEVRAAQLPDRGWLRTTDLARIDDDGFLWILGRADQTIIRGGMKVQPDTVRTALERHPGVRSATVVGVDDERLGQVPVAVVEPAAPGAVDEATLLEHASVSLARYEVPVRVVFVDAMPRTVVGKADLAAVRALAASPPRRGEP